jgi:hypothetical protein
MPNKSTKAKDDFPLSSEAKMFDHRRTGSDRGEIGRGALADRARAVAAARAAFATTCESGSRTDTTASAPANTAAG